MRTGQPTSHLSITRTPTTSTNSASSPSATATPITCLLTGMPTPAQSKHRIELHRGLNLITVCITLTAALLGSALFKSSLFLQGNNLTPDIHVISGPTSLSNAKSMLSPPPPYYMPNTKCHPNRPIPNSDSEPVLPPSSPHAHLFPSAQYSEANSLKELPITDPSNIFFTTIAVHSTKDNTYLSFNAHMGFIRPMTNDDILSFQEAADTTSKQLADMWETFLSCQNQYLDSIHNSTEQKQSNSSSYACSHTTKLSPDQELRNAGLDSRILSSYSEYHENETVTALELPPVSSPNLDPNSAEFLEQTLMHWA